MLSVIPDIDLAIERIIPELQHRGPTHSLLTLFTLFIPVFVIYRARAVPYFLALIQHVLIGDFVVAGQVQLLWPLSNQYYGLRMGIESLANMSLEWTAFMVSVGIMLKTKDIAKFFQPHPSNLVLIVPTVTVLLPTLLAVPLRVPLWLIPPHLLFMLVFVTSIIITVYKFALNVFRI